MTDIVERLENWNTVHEEDADCDGSLYLAARDEILRLREGTNLIADLCELVGVMCDETDPRWRDALDLVERLISHTALIKK